MFRKNEGFSVVKSYIFVAVNVIGYVLKKTRLYKKILILLKVYNCNFIKRQCINISLKDY